MKLYRIWWVGLLLYANSILFSSCASNRLPQFGKDKVKDIISALSLEEKIALVVGVGDGKFPPEGVAEFNPYTGGLSIDDNGRLLKPDDKVLRFPRNEGYIWSIPRLGIRSTTMHGAGAGLTIDPHPDTLSSQYYYVTAFPTATALAATWNNELVKKAGVALGNEVLEYGVDVLLAPGLNIHRDPKCGRNFEYCSEDPLLSGKITSAMVQGIQSKGVGTSIKHLAANNQEAIRRSYNAVISQRALREIYLRGFEIAVKESNPWTIMTSYNKLNGYYTAESSELLTTVVRKEWGYKGLIITDWSGWGSAVAKIRAGSNLLMPGSQAERKELLLALKNGQLNEKAFDSHLKYILELKLKTPRSNYYTPSLAPDLNASAAISREVASEAMVLLKNNHSTLPLGKGIETIAMFSKGSYFFAASGSGSGEGKARYTVSVNEGMKNAGFKIVKYLEDIYTQFNENILSESKANDYLRRRVIPQHPEMPISKTTIAGQVANSDIAVITIGKVSGEGHDNGYEPLSEAELTLIRDVAEAYHAAGKNVIVILNVGAVLEIASWRDYADAILLAWQTGQEGGNAVADILKGNISPSGKLPTTFPIAYKDVPSSKTFPAVAETAPENSIYSEGIYVGYRYYLTFDVPAAYEFGYGLSYTDFEYSNLKLSNTAFSGKMIATVSIKNTGKFSGKEVVQLYLAAPATEIEKPLYELKGYAKTRLLNPGDMETLTFELDGRSLASFYSGISSWVADKGVYEVLIGASSKDVRLKAQFRLDKKMVVEKLNDVLYPNVMIQEELSAAGITRFKNSEGDEISVKEEAIKNKK